MRQLLMTLCVLFTVSLPCAAIPVTYYMDDTGGTDDGVCDGTPACATFGHVIPMLLPGDTLILRDGIYDLADNDLPRFTCGVDGVEDGAPMNLITIRADNERQARIDGSTSGAGRETIEIHQCDHWQIIGLHINNGDQVNPGGYGDVVWIDNSSNITLKRNIITHNNRYANTWLLLLTQTHDSLFEENEFYYCHRDCVGGDGNANTFRRNYVNSRGHADLSPCDFDGEDKGYCSNFPGGDFGFGIYTNTGGAEDWIFENNISENNHIGFRVGANTNPITDIDFRGNITIGGNYGMSSQSRPEDVVNISVINQVAVSPAEIGINIATVTNFTCLKCSVFDAGDDGFNSNNEGFTQYGATAENTFAATNVLVMDSTDKGFVVADTDSWTNNYSASRGNGTNYDPAPPHASITNRFLPLNITNMGSNACMVYVHDDSNLKEVGILNTDIGASVLYAYLYGTLTSTKLWNLTTGAFNFCGAQVSGLNDDNACLDVHERLNVKTDNCPFPEDYD